MTEPGTTPHYSKEEYILPGVMLQLSTSDITPVCVWTSNALYREYPENIRAAKIKGCLVVNMDTSHLYAACNDLGIMCEYYAVVSDVLNDGSKDETKQAVNDLWGAVTDMSSHVITSQATLISQILYILP